MIHLLSDENFNGDVVHGLFLRHPDLDLRRVQDVGLEEAEDPDILEWAAVNNRIILTHDRATMPDFACARVATGQAMPGDFVIDDHMAVRQAIAGVAVVDNSSALKASSARKKVHAETYACARTAVREPSEFRLLLLSLPLQSLILTDAEGLD